MKTINAYKRKAAAGEVDVDLTLEDDDDDNDDDRARKRNRRAYCAYTPALAAGRLVGTEDFEGGSGGEDRHGASSGSGTELTQHRDLQHGASSGSGAEHAQHRDVQHGASSGFDAYIQSVDSGSRMHPPVPVAQGTRNAKKSEGVVTSTAGAGAQQATLQKKK
jgi:hypothetical protein